MSVLIRLFFFWRKNDVASILFKCLVWATLAWLAIGIFTSLQSGLIAGAVAAAVQGLRYAWRAHTENRRMLALCDGDRAAYQRLRTKANAGGMGGAMLREMIRAAAEEAKVDQDADEVEDVLDEATIENHRTTTADAVARFRGLAIEYASLPAEDIDDAATDLLDCYAHGRDMPATDELIQAFFPRHYLSICPEDFCNDDDHAALVQDFADATAGAWQPTELQSRHDEATGKWIVSFNDDGKAKTWRFSQDSDWLSRSFLAELIQYVEARSGCRVRDRGSEDWIDLTCLPPSLDDAIFVGDETLHRAA